MIIRAYVFLLSISDFFTTTPALVTHIVRKSPAESAQLVLVARFGCDHSTDDVIVEKNIVSASQKVCGS